MKIDPIVLKMPVSDMLELCDNALKIAEYSSGLSDIAQKRKDILEEVKYVMRDDKIGYCEFTKNEKNEFFVLNSIDDREYNITDMNEKIKMLIYLGCLMTQYMMTIKERNE